MELREPPDPRRHELLPVVGTPSQRRIAAGKPDYWDHATRLSWRCWPDEATAPRRRWRRPRAIRETWEPETTARNLRLIREARERGEAKAEPWLQKLEAALDQSRPGLSARSGRASGNSGG